MVKRIEQKVWVGPQLLTTRKKQTRRFYLFVQDRLSSADLENSFPGCFHNYHGEKSQSSFREIFWDNSNRSIVDCYQKDFEAIMKLTGLPASVLHYNFGVAQKHLTTAEINRLLKEEGMVSGAVDHVA